MRQVVRSRQAPALRVLRSGHGCSLQPLRATTAGAGVGAAAVLPSVAHPPLWSSLVRVSQSVLAHSMPAGTLAGPCCSRGYGSKQPQRGFAEMIQVPQMGDSITEGEVSMILGVQSQRLIEPREGRREGIWGMFDHVAPASIVWEWCRLRRASVCLLRQRLETPWTRTMLWPR